MTKALSAWKWGLRSLVRGYWTVVVLAVLIAAWIFAAYAWLGLPAESSGFLMGVSLLWAVAQLLLAAVVLAGIVSGAAEAAWSGGVFRISALWTVSRKKVFSTVLWCLAGLVFVWACSALFAWLNGHAVEVASFLTFHAEKPVSHLLIGKIYSVIEGLLWVALGGFLLSFLITLLRGGWREARGQTPRLLLGNFFQFPFLTSLLSVAVFGGIAYALANWRPNVPPGFWDYTQMTLRLSLALLLVSGGALYWLLTLARLQVVLQNSPPEQES